MDVLGQSIAHWEFVVFLFLIGLFIYRIISRRSTATASGPTAHMDDSLPGVITKLPTTWGDVYVRVFDPVKSGFTTTEQMKAKTPTPIVCLPGINAKLVDEWVPVADSLHQKGHFVIIINFHSNPVTTPALFFGGFSDDNVQQLLQESVLRGYLKGHTEVVLCGKSWGGKQAMQFAASWPNQVKKLCLVAPASTDQSLISTLSKPLHSPSTQWNQPTNNHLPVLLAWAKDDKALWFSASKVWVDTLQPSQLKLVTAEVGGHRILPEYLEPIHSFLAAQ